MIPCTPKQQEAAVDSAIACRQAIDEINDALAKWQAVGARGWSPMPATCYDGSPLIVKHNFACQDAYNQLLLARCALQECLRYLDEPQPTDRATGAGQ